jgi:5-methyltetrahydrofolate--homocysteine methyltransferase
MTARAIWVASWEKEDPRMADLTALTAAIEAGDRATATSVTRAAIEDGQGPETILAAMTAAMEIVGQKFQRNEIYVPEMLLSARAMKEATGLVEPLLAAAGIGPGFRAVIGTVKGDLHDIGKNLVGMMWKGANIEVIDLGSNVSPERFVAATKDHDAHLVGISALLTTTMVGMRDVVEALKAADLRQVRVVVGGAPVTAAFASQIGADGYAPDAASAVEVATRLVRA